MNKLIWIVLFASTASLTAAPQASNNQNFKTVADAAAVKTDAPAPAQDRFTTPDDQSLGIEVRGLIIETVGPDQAKGIILIIDKGDVQLNGTLSSEEKKKALIEAITKYKGVKSVNNKLNLKPVQNK